MFGYSQDVDDQDSRSAFMEASTRIGDSTRVTAELYHFHGDDSLDPIYSLRRDSYVEIGLEYYY
ncbi:hypothetical protein [Zhongshania sp.]|uniref:hypothetical protein n=1 Tax=Zhongshania sp. TaxID=1971902 RepID=UPI001B5F09D8|nr:hypothetical protein [Zhongshania sp.]MBQ0796137.1 hypothetical protein [Zhongshania sp.]